jgi:hypothetical protein
MFALRHQQRRAARLAIVHRELALSALATGTEAVQRPSIRGPRVYATQRSFNGPIGNQGHEVKSWRRFQRRRLDSLPRGASMKYRTLAPALG